jgi:hypothetical protein
MLPFLVLIYFAGMLISTAQKYQLRDHPYIPNQKIYLNIDVGDQFTVPGESGLWSWYFEIDKNGNRDSRPFVLCVKKSSELDPNCKPCHYSTRYESDISKNTGKVKKDHSGKKTIRHHDCGNPNAVKHHKRSNSVPNKTSSESTSSSDPLDPFLQRLNAIIEKMKTDGKPTETLQKLYLHLIAMNRTSFLEASKPDNFTMIWALITAGQLFPKTPAQELFPHLNNKEIFEMAQSLGLWCLRVCGVCVTMDESFIANKHTVLCLLQIPDSELKPIPFKMYVKGCKKK